MSSILSIGRGSRRGNLSDRDIQALLGLAGKPPAPSRQRDTDRQEAADERRADAWALWQERHEARRLAAVEG